MDAKADRYNSKVTQVCWLKIENNSSLVSFQSQKHRLAKILDTLSYLLDLNRNSYNKRRQLCELIKNKNFGKDFIINKYNEKKKELENLKNKEQIEKS